MATNEVSYGKLAGKLTIIYFITALILTLIFLFLNFKFQFSKNISNIGFLIALLFGTYISLSWFLRRNYAKWNIVLIKENEGVRAFSGPPLISILFGFYWRSIFLGVLTGALAALLKRMYGDYLMQDNELAIDAFAAILNCYICFYWLLKYQYGSYKIVALNSSNELLKNEVIENNQVVSDAKTSIKDAVIGILTTTAVASYFLLGLVQIFTTYGFFRHYWNWNGFVSFLAAMFTGYIPLIGTIAGVMGATKVWGWELWAAVLLFCFPLAISLVVFILGGTVSFLGNIFSNRVIPPLLTAAKSRN